MAEHRYTLTLSCPDRVGIVAAVSGFLAQHGGFIVEASYHTDQETQRFFMRQEIRAGSLPFDAAGMLVVGETDRVVITASTAELQAFMKKHSQTDGAWGKPGKMKRQ